jgi:hypothetical protein
MSHCPQCTELIGKSPLTVPHTRLKQLSGIKLSEGWLEFYSCDECHTRLRRVAPGPGFKEVEAAAWCVVAQSRDSQLKS